MPNPQEQIDKIEELVTSLSKETEAQKLLTIKVISLRNKLTDCSINKLNKERIKNAIKNTKDAISLSKQRKNDINKEIDARRSILSWLKAELLNT